MSVQHILNAKEGAPLVEEALDGLCDQYPQVLTRIDGFKEGVKVVVRSDWQQNKDDGKVAIVSGGGSGHEPAHAGLVGDGMLSAAVCGDVFASPQTKAVLAAILTVTGPAGCLVIIKNYTGDRLNFGLAVEQAKAQHGLKVEVVTVADDAALDADGHRSRGIAGTALVHKIAGGLAAQGKDLTEVAAMARYAAGAVRTMGVALCPCTVPGRQRDTERLKAGQMEVGMGIHGEPGARKADVGDAAQICDTILSRVAEVGGFEEGSRAVLLVNSLGSLMPLELTAVTKSAFEWCRAKGITIPLYASGAIVTSLDMHGVSLSLLKLPPSYAEAVLQLLSAPTTAPGWVSMRAPVGIVDAPPKPPVPAAILAAEKPPKVEGDVKKTPLGQQIEAAIIGGCKAVVANEALLTELDLKIGDGDCGITLRQGAEKVLADISSYPLNDARQVAIAFGASVSTSMGGTSGALYHIAAEAFAGALSGAAQPTGAEMGSAFCAAVRALEHHGGAKIGSATMMDALIPAREALEKGGSIQDAAKAAEEGAQATAKMTATLGRAAYVAADGQDGVRDPGAVACALWLGEAAKAVA
eukprot:Hpha_TRINITY_DN23481_c0_g1::TRINITY_DN23481_c0_g1_i1::g.114077::m.114077/K00863/DAK, TKFC; triose/dihydroxyacetone kinase / FAD-AMP lyase (cyclizing)